MMTGIPPTEIAPPLHEFVQLFSSTRRGAHLARLLAAQQLDAWGWPYGSRVSQAATSIVAELTANAVLHGRCQGRDFQLRLTMGPGLLMPTLLRIEVADARGEKRPDTTVPRLRAPEAESGRGLLLVDVFTDRWGVMDRPPGGKTIWAELDLPTS